MQSWSFVRLDLDLTVAESGAITLRGKAQAQLDDESSHGPSFGMNVRKSVMSNVRLTSGGTVATVRPLRAGAPILAILLRFDRTFHRGETIEVEFESTSNEQSSQFVWSGDGAYASWTESWYPIPAKAIDELGNSAAPGTTTVRMPSAWQSVSNGTRVSRSGKNGVAVDVWKTEVPAARSFVAAPFASVEVAKSRGRSIATYLRKPRPQIRVQTETLARAIEAMEKRFGAFPYGSYNIVEVPEDATFSAASEQGFIMVKGSLLDAAAGNLPLFAHEAAHGWWGNLVRTRGPGAKMLSEALAQYGAVISIEAIEGRAAANRFLRYSRENYNPLQCALGYFYMWRQGGDRALSKLADGRFDHNLSDSKGMWFHRMLRDAMGDDAYFSALREVVREYSGRQITLDAFRQIVLRLRPSPDMSRFLEQWLDREGAPVLDMEWWSVDRGRAVQIVIQQRQSGEPFDVPLDVAIETESGVIRKSIRLCERSNEYFLPVPARPLAIRLDPDDRVLMWRPQYGPAPEGPLH